MLVCVVFAYSHFVENPPICSWETNPSFRRWFGHSGVVGGQRRGAPVVEAHR
jgi:hypothetical protein